MDEAVLISIDKLGADARVRVGSDYSVERIGWQKVRNVVCLSLKLRVLGCKQHSGTSWYVYVPDVTGCHYQIELMYYCSKFIFADLLVLVAQHVHTQAEAIQELEELISLNGNAMARPRSNVRTPL